MRRRKIAGRAAGLFLGYLIAELLFVPLLVRCATIRHLVYLPRTLAVLAQSSKAGTIPRNYTLILGDSFAEGQGDWADAGLAAGGRPDFGAAHVIHAATGEDVITFGVGGASSVSGLVKNPLRRTAGLARFGLEHPRRVLAFFYEGNDLEDDLRDVRPLLADGAAPASIDAQRIDAFLAGLVLRKRAQGWLDNLGLPGVLANVLESLADADSRAEDGPPPPQALPDDVARIAGREVPLAPHMNGPALELTPEELELALRVFERSLAFCRGLYPDAELTVVYVPAPLSCYELVGDEVTVRTYLGRAARQPTALVLERSRELRARIGAIAAAAGLAFVDATDGLAALAREQPIHGPNDWGHFNEQGYRRLAAEILAARARALAPQRPESP